MPVVASTIVMALVIAFWWSQKESHDAQANRSLELHADATEREIRTGVNTRVQALVRMARRWEQRGGISQTHWERNAAQVYADMPGFQAIGLVDADYVVRWIVPLAGNEAAIDLDLSFAERRRQALNQARQKQVPTMTQSIRPCPRREGLHCVRPAICGVRISRFYFRGLSFQHPDR